MALRPGPFIQRLFYCLEQLLVETMLPFARFLGLCWFTTIWIEANQRLFLGILFA